MHNRSGWRHGKVIISGSSLFLLFYSIFAFYGSRLISCPSHHFNHNVYIHKLIICLPFSSFQSHVSGSDQQLNFILTALNYSNLYDISKVLQLKIKVTLKENLTMLAGPISSVHNELLALVDQGHHQESSPCGKPQVQRWIAGKHK